VNAANREFFGLLLPAFAAGIILGWRLRGWWAERTRPSPAGDLLELEP
jgi:hypothetical protein